MKRQVNYKLRGNGHGMISNMFNPRGLGNELKPFIFLDYIHGVPPEGAGFGWHPHSGIATFTYYIEGGSDLEESTGHQVSFRAGDIEYFQAGSGAWHKGTLLKGQPTLGFQLWIALPPHLETIDAMSTYLRPNDIPQNGQHKVLLGTYDGLKSPILSPNDMNYLDVHLKPGETWEYQTPETHDVLWGMVYKGRLSGNPIASAGELIAFEEGNGPVQFSSEHGASFLLGSAKKFNHDLVMGRGSVHTSEATLQASHKKINSLYGELLRNGIMET